MGHELEKSMGRVSPESLTAVLARQRLGLEVPALAVARISRRGRCG